ncbi:TetR family transcriptional regulator [Nocardioides convexus]|uniref:TetR family transcriptional regulator n=1 Tax=Nocardioides convexus TaxID=2712224 RepID=UPI00241835F8|nr:TetR family transcriptional regulator [Nocardioides convexus]
MHSWISLCNRREAKRHQTALRLQQCAVRLTVDKGFDGWTIDDLAVAADVSRRTVFNYFDGKAEVVLGPEPEVDRGAPRRLRRGRSHRPALRRPARARPRGDPREGLLGARPRGRARGRDGRPAPAPPGARALRDGRDPAGRLRAAARGRRLPRRPGPAAPAHADDLLRPCPRAHGGRRRAHLRRALRRDGGRPPHDPHLISLHPLPLQHLPGEPRSGPSHQETSTMARLLYKARLHRLPALADLHLRMAAARRRRRRPRQHRLEALQRRVQHPRHPVREGRADPERVCSPSPGTPSTTRA